MYIVREKATRKVLHVNRAPTSQQLEGTAIYHLFDPKTMEVGRGELQEPPLHFDIDKKGAIVPWTLQKQVDEGVLKLPPEKKVTGNSIVEKTLTEKVAEGLVKLKATEKVVGNRIEEKTVAEQVAEGLLTLGPTQVLDGDEIREMTTAEKAAAGLVQIDPRLKVQGKRIVRKTPAELVKDKLRELAPDEKIEGDDILKLTPREMLEEGRWSLQQYKQAVIARHAELALEARRKELPDHELLYAAIGALDDDTVEEYRQIVSSHVKKQGQVRQAIEKAPTADAAEAAAGLAGWPKKGASKLSIPT